MASSATLICFFALVAMSYGIGWINREERGLAGMFSQRLGSVFGNAVNFFADEGSAKKVCEPRGYFKKDAPDYYKRGLISLASDAVTGGLAAIGDTVFSPEAVKTGCEANGYFKREEVPQQQYYQGQGPPIYQRRPQDIQYVYDPPTVVYQDFEE